MEKTWHFSPKTGKEELCRAGKDSKFTRSCPWGGEHFTNKEEARAYAEQRLEEEYSKSLSGEKSLSENQAKFLGDIESARVSGDYARASLITGHLHNSSEVGSPLEQMYYASAQGRMELDRRILLDSHVGGRNVYKEIREKIDAPDFDIQIDWTGNQEQIDQETKEGKELLRAGSLENSPSDDDKRKAKFAIIDYSQKWMERLSPPLGGGVAKRPRCLGLGDESQL